MGATLRHIQSIRLIAAIALALSFAFGPNSLPKLDLCLFQAITGLPCPGCGITRAFCAISHGQLADAWSLNPFAFPFYALALLGLLCPNFINVIPNKLAIAAMSSMAIMLLIFGIFRILAV